MCRRRSVFEQYPIALPCPPERPERCESILAIGCLLPLRSNHVLDRKKSRDQENAHRCKCCPCRTAGHPSNAGSPKRKWASLFVTQNAQSPQAHLGFAASEARERGCD